MTTWPEYLGALETGVARAWELLESRSDGDLGSVLTEATAIPAEACPDGLQARALEVLRQINDVEGAIVNRQQELARELQRRPAAPAPADRVGWSVSLEM